MKIVKYVFLLLILAAVAISVFIATQSGTYTIQQEKLIDAPKPVLYGYVNDFKNWENLDFLTDADSTATYTYSDNTTGPGAKMSWKKNATDGAIQTVKAAGNDSIRQKATVNGLDSDIKWAFKDTVGGTKVKLTIRGELTFTEKAYALLENAEINKTLHGAATRGLNNLNAFLVSELKKFEFEVAGNVTKKGTYYLGQKTTGLASEVTKNAWPTFEKLLAFAKENKIEVAGSPFILYKNYSRGKDTVTYILSIPIKDEMFTSPGSEYEGGRIYPYKALKTTAKGDYSHIPKAWQATNRYIDEKAVLPNTGAPYIVIYTKNITHTRRPSAWVTDIYTPLEAMLSPLDSVQAAQPLLPPSSQNIKPLVNTPAKTTAPAAKSSTQSATPKSGTQPAGTTPAQAPKPKPRVKKNPVPTPVKRDSVR